jgi:hypothetical protein
MLGAPPSFLCTLSLLCHLIAGRRGDQSPSCFPHSLLRALPDALATDGV